MSPDFHVAAPTSDLSPKAANALLYLAFSGGEGLTGSRVDKKFRDELIGAGLVAVTKSGGRALTLRLLDAGWAALGESFPSVGGARRVTGAAAKGARRPAAKKSGKAAEQARKPGKLAEVETLDAVLAALRSFIDARGVALADVLAHGSRTRDEARAVSANDGTDGPDAAITAVTRAYRALAAHWGDEVRLAALRRALGSMPRDRVDAALRTLRASRRLTPYPIENARERSAEDDEAALVLGATLHHCVRIAEAAT